MAKYEYKIDSPDNYGGDKTEKIAWPLFAKDKFPNYELLWQRFVVFRTDRPNSIHLSQGVSSADREIAGIHYSILHNFYVIYKWLGELVFDEITEKQLFESAYVKLSTICDLTEELLFKLLVLSGDIVSGSPQIIKAVSEDAKSQKISEINSLTADKALDALLKRGTSSVIFLNRVSILEDTFDLRAYKTFSAGIRSYRNVIAHSWHSFQIDDRVPRPGYIKQYQDWAKVSDIIKSNDDEAKQKMLEHFMPMRELVQEQVDQLIAIVNKLWAEVIPHIPLYSKTAPASYGLPAQQPSLTGGSPLHLAASGTMISQPRSIQKP